VIAVAKAKVALQKAAIMAVWCDGLSVRIGWWIGQ